MMIVHENDQQRGMLMLYLLQQHSLFMNRRGSVRVQHAGQSHFFFGQHSINDSRGYMCHSIL